MNFNSIAFQLNLVPGSDKTLFSRPSVYKPANEKLPAGNVGKGPLIGLF